MQKKETKVLVAAICMALAFLLGAVAGGRLNRTVFASQQGVEARQDGIADSHTDGSGRFNPAAEDDAAQTGSEPKDWLTQTQVYSVPETQTQGIPQSVEEITAYFNLAVQRVKTEAASVTQTQDRLAILQAAFGKSDLREALRDLNRDDRTQQRIARESFPVRGEVWASRLPADGVESAQCALADGVYTITLRLREETGNPGKSGIHGSCMTIPNSIDWESLDVTGFKCRDFTLSYNRSVIECTVEAATGNLLTAHYFLHADAQAQVTVGGMLRRDCVAEVESEARYLVAWKA